MTWTSWSPRPAPWNRGSPFPRSRRTVPVWIPAGIRNRLVPSRVGTSTSAPSAAWTKEIGSSYTISSPSRALREAQLELHARIAARRRPATPTHRAPTAEELLEQGPAEAPAAPEERLEQVSAEDVLDIPRVGEPGPVETFAAPDLLFEAVRPELVVDPSLLVVREDLVRFGNLLELLFRRFRVVLVQVRMVFLREPAVCSLDLVLGRPARDAEPLIVVFVGHVALFPRDGPRSLLVHVLEVRVHDARVRRFARVAGSRRGSFRGSAFPIHLNADLLRHLVQLLDRRTEHGDVVRREDLPKGLNLLLDGLPGPLRYRGAMLFQELLGRIHELVGMVPQLDELAATAVLLRVALRIPDRGVDLRLVHPLRRHDRELFRLPRRHVFRGDVQDPIRVDIERHLDLRDACGRRRDAGEIEPTQAHVVPGHGSFALEHVDLDARLAVRRGREDLALARGDRRVPLDQLREDAAPRLDAEAQGGHIEQEDVFHLATEDRCLDRRAERDALHRVDRPLRGPTEDLLEP